MSQVDKVHYLPTLVWVIILFIIWYVLVLVWIIPMYYKSLRSRVMFEKALW
jgi:F0F1-type ATP synthase membrane subunit b/b'